MSINLPCIKCGADLPITEGSTTQCFACGTTNSYTESFDLFSTFVSELFAYTSAISQLEDFVDQTEIEKRMMVIDRTFNDYLQQTRAIEHLIYTKLDENIDEKTVSLLKLGGKIGQLGIVMEYYLIPHLENKLQEKQYHEMKILCQIQNFIFTSTLLSIEACKEFKPALVKEKYQQAGLVLKRTDRIIKEFSASASIGFPDEQAIVSALIIFDSILSEFLTQNPAYYAEELEQCEAILKDSTDARAIFLKKQIMQFYDLSISTMFLLEKLRKQKPFEKLGLIGDRILFYTNEVKEKFLDVKTWIEDLRTQFDEKQKQLMILHCGQRISYLEDYKSEFESRFSRAISQFNDQISQFLSATLSDFALEISDDFEILDIMMDDPEFEIESVGERLERNKFDLLLLEETVKDFLFDLLVLAIDEDLKASHSLEIITAFSERHALFDKKTQRFINLIIERFTEKRNKDNISLKEQKQIFDSKIFPAIKNSVENSFTLKLEDIPLPLFMELVVLHTQFEREKEYKMVLLLENSCTVTLYDVEATFFVPNSFRIKTRIMKIGKLKGLKKLVVDTNFIPEQDGRFTIMAMVSYKHTKETFWMPSIQIPIIVGNPDVQDEKLAKFYEEHGVDQEKLAFIKEMASNDFEIDTVEKERLQAILQDVEQLEENLDEEEEENEDFDEEDALESDEEE